MCINVINAGLAFIKALRFFCAVNAQGKYQ